MISVMIIAINYDSSGMKNKENNKCDGNDELRIIADVREIPLLDRVFLNDLIFERLKGFL
jgi:hypothetical protein